MMPIADTKKIQTCFNLLHARVTQPVAQANAVAALIRQAIIDNDLQEFLSPAQRTALATFVTDLAVLAASPVIATLAAKYASTHGKCLDIPGVN